jgi:glycosyltransferase involved in cell wall biosynthesis
MIQWFPSENDFVDSRFSIIIPSWNNLEFLKLCVQSIEKNSALKHQIIIHVNEGTDGTLDWVSGKGFDHTHSPENVGVCWAMNACRALVKTDYIVFLNDDMYMLPGWDISLSKEIERLSGKFFFLSSTVIEPEPTMHEGILAPYDYGNSPETFMEEKLLHEFDDISGNDWNGATWPPNVVHKDVWDLVGGYSIEYFPGLYSDPDFSMKLYEAGVRYFKGINDSRAYHFKSKSTVRISMNKGSKQFLNKWGITSSSFTKLFLKRGNVYQERAEEELDISAVKKAIIKSILKRFFWSFSGTGKTKGVKSYNNFLRKSG